MLQELISEDSLDEDDESVLSGEAEINATSHESNSESDNEDQNYINISFKPSQALIQMNGNGEGLGELTSSIIERQISGTDCQKPHSDKSHIVPARKGSAHLHQLLLELPYALVRDHVVTRTRRLCQQLWRQLKHLPRLADTSRPTSSSAKELSSLTYPDSHLRVIFTNLQRRASTFSSDTPRPFSSFTQSGSYPMLSNIYVPEAAAKLELHSSLSHTTDAHLFSQDRLDSAGRLEAEASPVCGHEHQLSSAQPNDFKTSIFILPSSVGSWTKEELSSVKCPQESPNDRSAQVCDSNPTQVTYSNFIARLLLAT
ncbi:unnamed protein product [Protopolystoma xenopodis]|uniref:Uncharacterized protein n=1 Tax=Protopolystoma xenopodis TaxID=117903 RepID=A0A3S5B3L3_9PLAT|nr:unnamed protein product [Protopolystoma xenopodis]